jgi:hypothetical protein
VSRFPRSAHDPAVLIDPYVGPWEKRLQAMRERALAAEARVRDLEDTVGELLALVEENPRWCVDCVSHHLGAGPHA